MDITYFAKKARTIMPVVRIGKSGLAESVYAEINKQLKHHKLIKIKLLNSFLDCNDKKDAAKKICSKTKSEIILQQGNMLSIYKK